MNINFAAITGTLESPCKRCERVEEDKEECSNSCKTLKQFQKLLDEYQLIFAGKIIDIEDSYPVRYYEENGSGVEPISIESGVTKYFPVGISITAKSKTIRK